MFVVSSWVTLEASRANLLAKLKPSLKTPFDSSFDAFLGCRVVGKAWLALHADRLVAFVEFVLRTRILW